MVGELNGARANHEFGEVPEERRLYGQCDFETDPERKIIEPALGIRGDIARVYLYMHHVYGDALPLTPAQQALFEAWHAQDPPDDWERSRNRAIARMQGAGNPLIEENPPHEDGAVGESAVGGREPPANDPSNRNCGAEGAPGHDPAPSGNGQAPANGCGQ